MATTDTLQQDPEQLKTQGLIAGALTNTTQPVLQTQNPDNTVAGQVAKLTNSSSPLMQSAKTAAKSQMNARGLINSSMAIGTGQKAVIDAATPIATADAQLGQDIANRNQEAQNTFAQNEQNYQLQSGLKAQDTASAMKVQQQQYDLAQRNQAAQQTLQNQLDMMRDVGQGEISKQIEAVKSDLSLNADLRQQYTVNASNVITQYAQIVADINNNKDLSVSQQQNATQAAYRQRDAALAALETLTRSSATWSWTGDTTGTGTSGTTTTGAGTGTAITPPAGGYGSLANGNNYQSTPIYNQRGQIIGYK